MSRTLDLKPVRQEAGRPLYELVRDAVRVAIDDGRLTPGDRIPSTKALSEMLDVSLVTVHRALQELVASGVLQRGQGRGTFVHEAYHTPEHKATATRFGLVFHADASLADSYHGQILEGIRRGAIECGADLVLLRYGEDWRNECGGYVYVNPFPGQLDRSPRFVGKNGSGRDRIPTMVVGARAERREAGAVDTDNIGLAREAVEHLASLGHRRVAFVGGTGELSNNIDRFDGYVRAVRERGLADDPALVIRHSDWQLDEASLGRLTALLTGPARPTAVFGAGYYFALNVYTAATRAGLAVPKDISIVGVDDPPSAQHLSPPLTTMRQPLMEVGRLALELLHEQVRTGVTGPIRRTLDAELVVRDSTAASRDAGRGGALAATSMGA